jgi:hypothetical protein
MALLTRLGGLHDISNCFCAAGAETLSSDGKVTGGASCIADGGSRECLSLLCLSQGVLCK